MLVVGAAGVAALLAYRAAKRYRLTVKSKARAGLQATTDAAVADLPSVQSKLMFKAGTHDGQARHDAAPEP